MEKVYNLGNDNRIKERWEMKLNFPEPNATEKSFLYNPENWKTLPRIVNSNGIKVEINKEMDPWVSYLLICGAYESGDIELIRKYIENKDKVVVFGAGIGLTSVAISCITETIPKVIEANPSLLPLIKKTAALNDQSLEIIYGSVGLNENNASTVEFYVSEEFWSSSNRSDTWRNSEKITVPWVDFLKIVEEGYTAACFDIEGTEIQIFNNVSLPKTLKKVLVEIHTPIIGYKNEAKLMNYFWNQGFQLVDSEGLTRYWERNV